MKRRPLRSTSTDNLCPSSTVFRSVGYHVLRRLPYGIGRARVGDDGAFDVDRVLDRLAVLRLRLAHLRCGPATLEQWARERHAPRQDRKSVVEGTSVSVRVDLGGRRIIKKKKYISHHYFAHRIT